MYVRYTSYDNMIIDNYGLAVKAYWEEIGGPAVTNETKTDRRWRCSIGIAIFGVYNQPD